MKMRELAASSGVSVATIKFYVREGLLPPGRPTSATQADYDRTHLERLRLIRVLREVGEMPLARIDAVLGAIDDDRTPLQSLLRAAHHALGPDPLAPSEALAAARRDVVDWIGRRGWTSSVDAPSFDVLAAALVALRDLVPMPEPRPEIFDPYADAAEQIAARELASIDPSPGRADTVRQIIVGTVVFERALVALRRLAEEHFSQQRFGDARPARRRRRPAD